MRIVGMDFETANPGNGSICAIGLAGLDNGKLVDKREWLIKPHKECDYFCSFCVECHGINYWDVRKSPAFSDVWLEMSQFLQEYDVVVCHNAPFDIRHLRGVLELYHLDPVAFNYACTLELSRNKLPELPSRSLNIVAGHFNHHFQHHNALDDAIACAIVGHQLGIEDKYIRQF
jgi:DNA polymerase-3 subunit epsilon